MALRSVTVLLSGLVLVTACTAVLGVEDVPRAPDAGSPVVTPGVESGAPVDDREAALTAYIGATCTKFRDCSRAAFDSIYKDFDECTAATGAVPRQAAAAKGVTAAAKEFRECTTAVTAQTCDVFGSAEVSPACAFKGTRKLGEKCLSRWQCDTGFCAREGDDCGVCAVTPERGTPCASGFCGGGLKCAPNNTCVTESRLGETCDNATKPCILSLACVDKVCVTQPAVANAACDSEGAGCAIANGLICVDSKCVSIIFNGPGGECDFTADQPKLCRRSATCTVGLCGTPPAEGEACGDSIEGPGTCLGPLTCENGKCTKPKAITCD